MLNKKRGQKGFTLIELLIVIAIIGILAAIAIPMYRAQTVKARISEATNNMSAVASGVGTLRQDEGRWPGTLLNTEALIQTSLGVSLPTNARYFTTPSVSTAGVISFTLRNTGDGTVDTTTLTMTPTLDATTSAITWAFGGTIPTGFLPRR